MGGRQSRVETPEASVELQQSNDESKGTEVTMTITPELASHIRSGAASNGSASGSTASAQQGAALTAEQQQQIKRQLQEAYKKGAEDYRKHMEAEQKKSSSGEPAKKAQMMKEMEARENTRVEQLVKEINEKNYRAPLREVQCGAEREACLECYRTNATDVLKCREVAEAFARCAQVTTEEFVKDH